MKDSKDYNWDWIEGHTHNIMKALPNNGSVPEKRSLLFVDLLEKTTERKDFTLEHSDGKVNYSLNTNGFRGDDFTKVHNKKHIIFLGCSETYGEAGELEDSWSHMVYSKISKKFDVGGFYNLGSRGAGWFDIISLIPQYIEKFGNPDLIFMMLPNMERYISWVTEKEAQLMEVHRGYYTMSVFSDEDIKRIESEDKKYFFRNKTNIDLMDDFAKMSLSIKLLETCCNQKNINLFWSTTHIELRSMIARNFSDLFKNFVKINDSPKELHDIISSNSKLGLTKKDKMHCGTAQHTIWSDSLFRSFLERETTTNE